MSRRGTLESLTTLLGALLCAELAEAQPITGAQTQSAAPTATATDDYARLVALALDRFAQKDYLAARDAYDRALSLAETDTERATLTFNAGVAAYEGHDYAGAEQRFLRSAEYDPSTRAVCFTYAGLAALELRAVPRAEHYLEAARALDPPNEKRRALERGISDAKAELTLVDFRAALRQGSDAYRSGDLDAAERALALASEEAERATVDERVTLELLLGRIRHARGDLSGARRHYETAARLAPKSLDTAVALGDVSADEGELERAEQHYRDAEDQPLQDADRALVERRIEALYPIPRSGLHARGMAALGYDSNAAQSGFASTLNISGSNDGDSALAHMEIGADYVFRLGERAAIGPFYAGSTIQLLEPAVAELSLQSHEAGLAVYRALGHGAVVRVAGSALLYVAGQRLLEPFLLEPGIEAQLDVAHGATWATSLSFDFRSLHGLSGHDELDGHRFDARLRENARLGATALWVEGSFGKNGMGVSEIETGPLDFAACDPSRPPPNAACFYHVPLGYWMMQGRFGTSYAASKRLSLSAHFGISRRRYVEDSYLVVEPPPYPGPFAPEMIDAKRRVDVRYEAGLGATLLLDSNERMAALVTYSLLMSTSNIAQDATDPHHAFDYDDRNFTQHVFELGVSAAF